MSLQIDHVDMMDLPKLNSKSFVKMTNGMHAAYVANAESMNYL